MVSNERFVDAYTEEWLNTKPSLEGNAAIPGRYQWGWLRLLDACACDLVPDDAALFFHELLQHLRDGQTFMAVRVAFQLGYSLGGRIDDDDERRKRSCFLMLPKLASRIGVLPH